MGHRGGQNRQHYKSDGIKSVLPKLRLLTLSDDDLSCPIDEQSRIYQILIM